MKGMSGGGAWRKGGGEGERDRKVFFLFFGCYGEKKKFAKKKGGTATHNSQHAPRHGGGGLGEENAMRKKGGSKIGRGKKKRVQRTRAPPRAVARVCVMRGPCVSKKGKVGGEGRNEREKGNKNVQCSLSLGASALVHQKCVYSLSTHLAGANHLSSPAASAARHTQTTRAPPPPRSAGAPSLPPPPPSAPARAQTGASQTGPHTGRT